MENVLSYKWYQFECISVFTKNCSIRSGHSNLKPWNKNQGHKTFDKSHPDQSWQFMIYSMWIWCYFSKHSSRWLDVVPFCVLVKVNQKNGNQVSSTFKSPFYRISSTEKPSFIMCLHGTSVEHVNHTAIKVK